MRRDEITELFDRYWPMVYRRAHYILGGHEDAQEAAQEVFLRAMSKLAALQKGEKVSSWLYSITTNYCLNRLRDRKRRRALWEEHKPDGAELPAAPDPTAMILVRKILASVDEEIGRAAIYVHVDGMSHAEAAKQLGVSRRTVGNLLERFGEKARQLATEDNDVQMSQSAMIVCLILFLTGLPG